MNLKWKDMVIVGLGSIIVLLAVFKLIDLMYLEDSNIEIAVVGFFGTIIGGVLSGAITLIGVSKTIKENRRKDELEKIPKTLLILKENESFMITHSLPLNNIYNIDDFEKTIISLESIISGRDQFFPPNKELFKNFRIIETTIKNNLTSIYMGDKVKWEEETANLINLFGHYIEFCKNEQVELENKYYDL